MADYEPRPQCISEPGHSHDAAPPSVLPGKQSASSPGPAGASVAAPRPSGVRSSSPRTPEDERRFIELFGGAPEASWSPASLLAAPAGADSHELPSSRLAAPAGADSHELPRIDLAARGANAKSAAKGGADGRGTGPRPLESKARPPAAGAEQAKHSAVSPERELLLFSYLSNSGASAAQLEKLLFSGLDSSEALELHARLSAEPPPRADLLATAFRARLSAADRQSILTRLTAFKPVARDEQMWSELAPGEATQPIQLVSRVGAPQGVVLRSRPAGPANGPRLPFDTLISVTRKTERGWYWVTSLGDDHPDRVAPTGASGFIEASHVASKMPEPTAHLQKVESEAMLMDIAKANYGVKQGPEAWVHVQAIYHANKDRDVVFRKHVLLGVDRRPIPTTNLRETVELLQTARVGPGQALWLPSKEFVQRLKAAGVIHEVSLPNMLREITSVGSDSLVSVLEDMQYEASLGVGLLEGAWGALEDLLTGAVDVLKVLWVLIKDNFTGYPEIRALIGKLGDAWDKRSDLASAIQTDFMAKWQATDDWKRGNFHGEFVGYLLMLLFLIYVTAGSGAAVVGTGRFGSFVKLIRLADEVGSIGTYARKLRAAIKLPQKVIDDTAQALGKKIVKPDAASSGSGHAGNVGSHGSSGHTGAPHTQGPSSQTPHGPTSQTARSADPHGPSTSSAPPVRRNSGEPYGDPSVHPERPRRYFEKHELVPTRKLKLVTTWKQATEHLGNKRKYGVPIGRKLHAAAEGHDIVARLARGDASALKQLGINDAPHNLDTTGREWALVETRDGFAIVVGRYGQTELPAGTRALAHSHPGTTPAHPLDANEHATIDLPVPEGGKTYAELIDNPTVAQTGITPSARDIHAISDGGEHVIYTRFIHRGDGKIGNPGSGETTARVNLHLSGARVVRFNPRTDEYWYMIHVHVKDSTGKSLWSDKFYAYWTPGDAQILKTQVKRPALLDREPAGGWQRP